jgi:plastocyanin
MNLSGPRRLVSGMALLSAILLAGIVFGGLRDAAAANQSVSIDGFAFLPGTVSIAVGDTVTWRNDQPNTPHTVSSDTAGVFDSGSLSTGKTFAQTFSAPGNFAYHCNIHPGMSGLVIVTGAAATAAATATSVPPTATTIPPTSTAVPATATTSAASPSASASPTPLATTGSLAPATGTKDGGDGGTSAGIWIVAAIAALAVAGAAGFALMRRRGTSPGP